MKEYNVAINSRDELIEQMSILNHEAQGLISLFEILHPHIFELTLEDIPEFVKRFPQGVEGEVYTPYTFIKVLVGVAEKTEELELFEINQYVEDTAIKIIKDFYGGAFSLMIEMFERWH